MFPKNATNTRGGSWKQSRGKGRAKNNLAFSRPPYSTQLCCLHGSRKGV